MKLMAKNTGILVGLGCLLAWPACHKAQESQDVSTDVQGKQGAASRSGRRVDRDLAAQGKKLTAQLSAACLQSCESGASCPERLVVGQEGCEAACQEMAEDQENFLGLVKDEYITTCYPAYVALATCVADSYCDDESTCDALEDKMADACAFMNGSADELDERASAYLGLCEKGCHTAESCGGMDKIGCQEGCIAFAWGLHEAHHVYKDGLTQACDDTSHELQVCLSTRTCENHGDAHDCQPERDAATQACEPLGLP